MAKKRLSWNQHEILTETTNQKSTKLPKTLPKKWPSSNCINILTHKIKDKNSFAIKVSKV